jgi:DNA-binding GntR family transcriptional regulator
VSRENLSDKAYSFIKNKIINGDYEPGSIINETMICDEISSSRTPVREAINKLEQENLVKVIYKKGIIIKDITLSDIKLIYETRLLIEPYAMRNYGKQMDPNYILMLKKKIEESTTDDALFQADDELHYYIVSQTNNIYLINAITAIYGHNMRIRILSAKNIKERIEATSYEHNEIIKYFIEENYEKSAQVLTHHLIKAREASYKFMLEAYNLNRDFIKDSL